MCTSRFFSWIFQNSRKLRFGFEVRCRKANQKFKWARGEKNGEKVGNIPIPKVWKEKFSNRHCASSIEQWKCGAKCGAAPKMDIKSIFIFTHVYWKIRKNAPHFGHYFTTKIMNFKLPLKIFTFLIDVNLDRIACRNYIISNSNFEEI